MLRAKYLQPGLRRTEAAQFDFDKGLICFLFFFLRQKGWLNLLWRSRTQPHSRTVYTATQTRCTWSRLHTANAHMWPGHTCSVHMLVKGKKKTKLNSGKISGIRIQMEGNVQAVSLLRSFVMASEGSSEFIAHRRLERGNNGSEKESVNWSATLTYTVSVGSRPANRRSGRQGRRGKWVGQ